MFENLMLLRYQRSNTPFCITTYTLWLIYYIFIIKNCALLSYQRLLHFLQAYNIIILIDNLVFYIIKPSYIPGFKAYIGLFWLSFTWGLLKI